jgi:hypothetical protein
MMTRSEVQFKIRALREELENRYKTGTVKMASADGVAIPTEDLQNQMFSLIYKLSKME